MGRRGRNEFGADRNHKQTLKFPLNFARPGQGWRQWTWGEHGFNRFRTSPRSDGDPNQALYRNARYNAAASRANHMQQTYLDSMTYKNLPGRSRDYALIVFNLIGAVLYVRLASRGWAVPQEKGLHSQTAEPFIWFMSVMPIFTIFSLVDGVWGALIVGRRQWRSGYLWLSTALIWLVAAVIDVAHH